MDAVTGPPAKMAGRRDELTPMMGQYFDLCEQYPDSLVLFQVGDFYEAFCEAAERVSRLLDITLTKREDSTGEYPMAGIPIDNAESYVETLLSAGYRVAIADQVQDPDEATGVVDRAVTRVVTPGTLTETELLDADDNNYVASIAGEYALALMDVSTGEFAVTSVDTTTALRNELGRTGPSEVVLGPDVSADLVGDDVMVTPFDEAAFDAERAGETVGAYFPDHDEVLAGEDERRACGALLAYAEYARSGEQDHLDYLNELTRYDPAAFLRLDEVAIESLELFDRRTVHGDEDGTLFGVLDETACALGGRQLKEWLRRPLVDVDEIEARLDAVEELTGLVRAREALHDELRDVYDVERLIGRVSRGRANARDLLALKRTLDVVPEVRTHLADVESDRLQSLRGRLDEMTDVRDLVDRAIREDPPQEITEGDVIARGYDEDLDALRETEREGREWVADLEEAERERTGIDSLKVGYNEVHGYYIEVTKPNLDHVPDDYTRRQTLKNSERFYTPELKQREDEILRAEQQADTLEHRLFREVRDEVAAESERVQRLARALAELDALVALAEVAVTNDYCRPSVGADGVDVVGGRHPVVEHAEARFVPNDADLTDERLAVVTGPNMSGKSTYMRQVALICILAQMGSFVPAERARLPVLDRVFTRIGASDDIAGGRSTFMIEMAELTDILREATADSMVLLDEVGRGTSTADGLAIARAVTEYLHDEVGAYTLFATHHHDLTRTAAALPDACNLHFDADREDGEVVFTHRIERGASSSSYGVEVADMAGVPDAVVERSRDLLAAEPGVEPGDVAADADAHPDAGGSDDAAVPGAADATAEDGDASEPAAGSSAERVPPAVAERLREANVAETTPLEALELLSELKRSLDT